MARIRTVKPEFFTSEDIVGLSAFSRLLYIAIWCEADKAGRLEWKPKTLKMRYFPADDIDITALCQELTSRGLVVPYGDGLAHIPTFGEHQHINPRETASKLPEPPRVNHASPRVPDASPRVSDAQGGREGKGKEGEKSPDGHLPDPVKEFFDLGIAILTAAGHSERSARGLLGKLRKAKSDPEAAALLVAAKATSDPAAYLSRAMLPRQREFVE